MLNKMVSIWTSFAVIVISGAQPSTGQESENNWKITSGQNGKVVTIVYADPATYLKIEKDLTLTVDATGTAMGGVIHFKNGFQRPMTPEETAFYFSSFNGDNAYWDFREKQGSVETVAVGQDPFPMRFVGTQVRAVSKDGKYYIGIFSLLPTSPDWFALNIKNNRMLFYRNAVKAIQQLTQTNLSRN